MSLMLKCSRCSRDMHSSGFKGLCPQCLFACTTGRVKPTENFQKPEDSETIAAHAQIGAGGRFLLLEKIGEGGMGEVWLADDQQLSSPDEPHFVALKFLSESIRENKQALRSLKMEVRQAQELNHPNIVRIHDLHTSAGGMPFINMEYIEGDNLSNVLQRSEGGVLSSRLVLQVARQLASALHYAHDSAGILHRDIKPSNLLLAEGDLLKLTDFGIAGVLHGQKDEHALHTQVLGTLWYSSPRQALGKTPTPADDIYSYGATLYELVTGAPPFEGDSTEEILAKIQYAPPEHIANRLVSKGRRNDLPPKFVNLIHRCLDKEPLNRPLARDLANLLPPLEVPAPRPHVLVYHPEQDPSEPDDKPEADLPQSKRFWWPALILALLFIAAAGVVWARWPQLAAALGRDKDQQTQFKPPIPSSTNKATWTNETEKSVAATNEVTAPPDSDTVLSQATVPLEVRIKDNGNEVGYRFQLLEGDKIIDAGPVNRRTIQINQPRGTYLLKVSRKENKGEWTQSAKLILTPENRTQVNVAFYQNQVLVDSEPEGAHISWEDLDKNKEDSYNAYRTKVLPDFTADREKGTWLRSGHYRFHASMRGYLPWEKEVTLNTDGKMVLPVKLVINPCPAKGELAPHTFTNSFQTVFIGVGASSAPTPGTPLYACATETSVGEFREFAATRQQVPMDGMFSATTNGYLQVGNSWEHPGWAQNTNHPVVGVNWNDAMAYCEWLTKTERGKKRLEPNQKYRLPSAKEWKKIAGGQKYPWGDSESLSDIVGNYSGEEVATSTFWPASWPYLQRHNDGYQRTAPPEPKFTNSFGFYHMGGNAAEWCLDQVLCGGSWFDGEDGAYGHNIGHLATDNELKPASSRRDDRYGFRVVIVEEEK